MTNMTKRTLNLMLMDALAAVKTLYLAFLIRFDFIIPEKFLETFFYWAPWFMLMQIAVFYFSDLYARIWRYTSLFDLYAILGAVTIVSAISVIFIYILSGTNIFLYHPNKHLRHIL